MSVYPVREDTLLVKRNIGEQELEGKKFLEIGVGNGEVSLKAAERGANVTAVDINPDAVQHVKERFQNKKIDAEIFQSNLFNQVEGKYDLIVFNPPYLMGEEGIGDEEMWRGGHEGTEVAEKYLNRVSKYLNEDGEAWVVLSSKTDYQEFSQNFNLQIIDYEKLQFEKIYLLRFK